jgi:phosphoribosylaminoimidazole-succinocarboxamide synthase
VIFLGSVKDLVVESKPTENEEGIGVFRFTDDYSVFDYGKMPDTIAGKGEALNRMASHNFAEIKKLGLKSHFIERVSGNEMRVKLVRVINPQTNPLTPETVNCLIPLEIIFRNSLPKGSSVFRRVEKGELSWQQLGLTDAPVPGAVLEKPILEASTKLEETDRYLSWSEAQKISGLTDAELKELKGTALKVNNYLNQKAESIGLVHADGKIECAMDSNRNIMVVDVFGTLDEDRFLMNGVHVSKQILRDYYLKGNWFRELSKAKSEGKPKAEWPAPKKLPSELAEMASLVYRSACNEWSGERVWGIEPLSGVIERYLEWKKQE